MAVAEFRTYTFNQLPSLEHSNQALKDLEAHQPNILSELRTLLIKHNKNNDFGFSLLHKHFPLSENEILVELDQVTTPWALSNTTLHQLNTKGIADYGSGIIYPTSWTMTKVHSTARCQLMPYEFAFSSDHDEFSDANHPDSSQNATFIRDVCKILQVLNVDHVFALTILPEANIDGAKEQTVGRANILRLRGEHRITSPAMPSGSEHSHDIQASFFWPTNPDGTISVKAKGASCEGWDTCKATV